MLSVSEIIKRYSDDYLEHNKVNNYEEYLLKSITNCKTENNGYHVYKCQNCGEDIVSYNPCNNRHCPRCGNYKKEVWKERIRESLLDMNYYHIVVCIPNKLKRIFIQNKLECYNLFLKVVSESICELNSDKKIGMIELLHTWSQKLEYHPHVHVILAKYGVKYNKLEEINTNLEILEYKIRKKLISKLKTSNLSFYDSLKELNTRNLLIDYLNKRNEEFIIYKKEEIDSNNIIEYLGRNIFKVGMSDERLVSIDNNKIVFKYRFWKDRSKIKTFTLSSDEYIRRFLLHILPKNFVKVRYIGMFQTKNKNEISNKYKLITKTIINKKHFIDKISILNRINRKDVRLCDKCNLILKIDNHKPPSIKSFLVNEVNI